MLRYLLPLLAGLCFALQFCANKYFEQYKKRGNTYTVLFTLWGKLASTLFFAVCFLVAHARMRINAYTFLVGAVQAALTLTVMLAGIPALKIGNMGMYTVAMMIGGMAVPTVFGALYFHGPFGILRGIAFCIIAVAVVLSAQSNGKKPCAKAAALYVVLFLCNGAVGVFSDLHANKWCPQADGFAFVFVTSCIAALLCLPVLAVLYGIERKQQILPAPPRPFEKRSQAVVYYLSPCLGGICNGLGNLLILVCTAVKSMGSVATFPLVTGGTILCTTLLSFFLYKEKITVKSGIGIALILCALVLFVV